MEPIWNELYTAAKAVLNLREVMAQLMPDNYRDIEIMLDYDAGKIATLGRLTPEWWI